MNTRWFYHLWSFINQKNNTFVDVKYERHMYNDNRNIDNDFFTELYTHYSFDI